MPTYEMFWDCPHCGTTKLLGKTHRHCPNCGAAQEPDSRYFPPEEEKVAVEDHQYVGVDRKCVSCDSPNAADAEFCTNCGSPLDEAAAVGVKGAVQEGQQSGTRKDPTPPEPEAPGASSGAAKAGLFGGLLGTGCLGLVAVGVIVLIVLCAVNTFWTSSADLAVTGHTWTRTIAIEQLGTVTDHDWCDDMPSGAIEKSRKAKKKSSKKVKDGQTCKTENVDQGDGTFKKVEKCKPKYREEPINKPWCTFEVEKWREIDTKKASGGLKDAPSWPKATADGCKQKGCTRKGERKERYVVKLKEPGGVEHECALPQSRWKSMAVGSKWKGAKGMVTGGLDCDGLKPK